VLNNQVRDNKNPNDVVIIKALRTPIGKARKGLYKDATAVELLAPVLKAVVDGVIDPKLVGDIVCGTVLAPGGSRATEVRMAAYLAGFPDSVPVRTVNRQCSSGLQAIADVASAIAAGYYEIGIGCGVEMMTVDSMGGWTGGKIADAAMNLEKARHCLTPMGITSENVAARYNVSREEQDKLAVVSNERALRAIRSGAFRNETVPVEITQKDVKTGALKRVVVEHDDGPRETSLEALGQLKPAFKKGGSTTAGNSSQVSDGAAACLIMRRSAAAKLNLPIMGVFRSYAVAGVPPDVMGVGPAFAIPLAVRAAGISLTEVDLFEINEAFASQAVYCVNKLGLSWDKVNVNGGAIAIGHPLGATGARQTATLLSEMKRRRVRYGVVSMCIGTGMGAAAVYEVEY